jgi:hypothetical protein
MGLIKTGLKAAVFVKTADVVHERILRRQEEHWAARGGAPGNPSAPPAQPASPADSTLAQLTQLGELRASGVLTEAEFQEQKARILNPPT